MGKRRTLYWGLLLSDGVIIRRGYLLAFLEGDIAVPFGGTTIKTQKNVNFQSLGCLSLLIQDR
jgi:hypothetical protein